MGQIKDKLMKAIIATENELKSRKNMKILAEMSAEIVRDRTRVLGKGVQKRGGYRKDLAPLTKSTIEKRRRNKKLHPSTSPSRSNLTETGQMLDGLYGKSDRKGEGEIAIKSRRKGTTKTNDEVAFFVSGKRPFLDLSSAELKKLEDYTEDKSEKLYEKNLKKLT